VPAGRGRWWSGFGREPCWGGVRLSVGGREERRYVSLCLGFDLGFGGSAVRARGVPFDAGKCAPPLVARHSGGIGAFDGRGLVFARVRPAGEAGFADTHGRLPAWVGRVVRGLVLSEGGGRGVGGQGKNILPRMNADGRRWRGAAGRIHPARRLLQNSYRRSSAFIRGKIFLIAC